MKRESDRSSGAFRVTGLTLLALSWMFLLPVYDRPIPWLGWLLVLAAVASLAAAGASTPSGIEPRSRWRIGALAVAVAVGLLLPMPFRAGFALLGLGLLTGWRLARRPGAALATAGAAFLVQGLCFVGYELVASATPALRLGAILAPVLRWLFGVESVVVDGELFVGVEKLQLVAVTLDSLGVLVPLLVAAPLWALSRRGGTGLRIHLLLIVYAVVRYAALVVWSVEHPEHYGFLLTPLAIAASYLPLFGLLWLRPVSAPSAIAAWPSPRALRLRPMLYAAGAAAAACIAYGWTGVDSGVDKGGRILVDDSHGAWESGTADRSLENFGTDSTYTYSALWDWLDGYYPTSVKTTGALTADDLRDTDVLVLKTPSKAYSPEERRLIEAFVAGGGGVFAIGDHTDVFGTTTVLNSVLQPFGLEIEKNVGLVVRKRYIGDHRFRKDRFFANPLTHGIESAFDFMGAASVLVTEGFADHVVQCQAQVLEGADYRDTSFFGDRVVDLDDVVRPYHACVAKRFGAGRVVVWGDSTVFSNFSMFDPGKPEVILSIVSYLNKANARPLFLKPGARILGLLLAGVLFYFLSRRRTPDQLVSILAGGAAGLLVVAAHGRLVQEASYREPSFDQSLTIVGFDLRNGDMGGDDPPGDGIAVEQRTRSGEFESLFQAPMRIPGCFPRAVTDYDDLADVDVLFLVGPKQLSRADEETLARAVEAGLQLVVVQDSRGGDGARSLLQRYGMSFRAYPDTTIAISEVAQLPRQVAAVDTGVLAPLDAALHLVGWEKEIQGTASSLAFGATILGVSGGGTTWGAGPRSVPILARSPAGRGAVHAFAAGDLFRNTAMGGSSSVILPFDPQMASYRVFEQLVEAVRGRSEGQPHDLTADSGAHEHGAGGAPHEHATVPGGHAGEDHAHPAVAAAPVEAAAEPPGAADSTAKASPLASTPAPGPGFVGPIAAPTVVRARVSVLLKNSSQAAFYGGYAVEGEDGGYLRMVADNGTGRVGRGSPTATILLTSKAFGLIPRGGVGALGSRRGDRASGSSLLALPPLWSGEAWTEETVEGDPWEFVNKSIRDRSIVDLGEDVMAADTKAAGLPADGWEPLPEDDRYRVLRTKGVVPLGGELVGKAEVWIGERSGRPRKLTLSFRLIGDVSEVDWYDVVILHDDYRTHAGFQVDLDADFEERITDWVDLNDGIAFAEAR